MISRDAKTKARFELGDELDYVLREYLASEKAYRSGQATKEVVNEKKARYEAVALMYKWRFG